MVTRDWCAADTALVSGGRSHNGATACGITQGLFQFPLVVERRRQNRRAQIDQTRPGVDGHAGEGEISNVMASRPELVHTERSASESGADLNRLTLPDGVSTGIWWYAKFPNHYQGDSSSALRPPSPAVEP